MTDSRVRILAVAPYESMKNALQHAAEGFPDLAVDVRLGDLAEGAEIVRSLPPGAGYDAIISRGGTAGLIRGVTDVPVIEINVSVYDVLRTIRLAENYMGRFSVVGFPAVTEAAHLLCNLLRYRCDILTVHSEDEVQETLSHLSQLAPQAVVCDAVTHRTARALGFSAFLIASGEESLHEAPREAAAVGGVFRRMRRENAFLHLLLQGEATRTFTLDEEGALVSAQPAEPSPGLLEAMRRRIRALRAGQEAHFYHRENDELHEIACRRERFEGQNLFLFRDRPAQLPLRVGLQGLSALDREECEELFASSFYAVSGAMGDLKERLPELARARQPLLILGEAGTGREQIARALYLSSGFTNRPFTVVDCRLTDARTWDFLFTHHASPLSGRDAVIFFKDLDVLPPERFPELHSAILDTNLPRRMRLLFSCTAPEGQPVPPAVRAFSAEVGCRLLPLPTLRSRPDEIPSLASLYLNSLAPELDHPIAGFEPGALDQLIAYDWPANYTQFKNVLRELAGSARSAYISSAACFEVLRRERRLNRSAPAPEGGVPYRGRPLGEIEAEIFRRVLADCGGNRTEAARILGVSRTTLWRTLSARGAQEEEAWTSIVE